jgi:hypothetical protein
VTENLRAKMIVWWRINVSGRLHLGEFLRFMLRQKEGTP